MVVQYLSDFNEPNLNEIPNTKIKDIIIFVKHIHTYNVKRNRGEKDPNMMNKINAPANIILKEMDSVNELAIVTILWQGGVKIIDSSTSNFV